MTLAELERGFEIHEKQMRELRDNQIVQGEMLAKQGDLLTKASSVLLELANRINEISERQAVTQAGIESLIKFMDTFKDRLGGGDGHNPT